MFDPTNAIADHYLAAIVRSSDDAIVSKDPNGIVTNPPAERMFGVTAIDGWELITRLKRNFATSSISIVALTAYGMRGEAEHAAALGCVEYVAKPISTEALPEIVRQHLRRAWRRWAG